MATNRELAIKELAIRELEKRFALEREDFLAYMKTMFEREKKK